MIEVTHDFSALEHSIRRAGDIGSRLSASSQEITRACIIQFGSEFGEEVIVWTSTRLSIFTNVCLLISVKPGDQPQYRSADSLRGISLASNFGHIRRRYFSAVELVPINLGKPAVSKDVR